MQVHSLLSFPVIYLFIFSLLIGISKLTNLTRLNLGNNQLKSLEDSGLDKLTHLHHLSLEFNKIISLSGLQKLYTLTELYLGNNRIHFNSEVYHLKVNMILTLLIPLFGSNLLK